MQHVSMVANMGSNPDSNERQVRKTLLRLKPRRKKRVKGQTGRDGLEMLIVEYNQPSALIASKPLWGNSIG